MGEAVIGNLLWMEVASRLAKEVMIKERIPVELRRKGRPAPV